MRPLSYARPHDAATAVAMVGRNPGAAFLAGGTTEVDLLRIGVHRHDLLVDINELPYREVEELPGGGLRLGALSRMSDVARDQRVMARYPAVSQALLLGRRSSCATWPRSAATSASGCGAATSGTASPPATSGIRVPAAPRWRGSTAATPC
ncbi:hypothetical protein Pflav_072690 [Phytohabitans flavus]|uniref:Molybdopterin dehydrogenase FAD-binding domain-containing protein n=1 Tax=Phytohabitans flavus TaxID=1076124 RepID=A0A6F8Y4A5_9ACTN|nr:hypothetical protein Pflav_072690 [Phytohabitans flavus]